MTGYTAQPTVS